MIKRQVGTMACMCCGHEIPVKQGENGTINAACPWCDFPAYAKAGTEAHRIILGRMKTSKAPEPEAAPTPEPAPRAKPAPRLPAPEQQQEQIAAPARKRNSIFDLG
ncbi:hypothetical protein C6571_16820 [Simplicispira suum]|uniref:Uncharacterized protein n=1 Tax=Simplicispira suum TaxID=2109915 RepID=A0A2S0N3L3_9BURK|nr:hypothetical protein C6571_16820 [Simplicispira suum]